MVQILHGSATTTHAVRTAIQRSKAPLKELAAQYGLNHKTVAKWRKRAFVHDAAMGPRMPRSTVLSAEEEALVIAFRKHTLLALDDCLYALQATIPRLTRSSLHRCFKRHGISRLPEIAGEKPARQPFKAYPIGYFHIDIAEVRTEEGKQHLFVAVDRTSKFAFAQLHEAANVHTAAAFLTALIDAVPYQIHTVLTDNGVQFGDMPSRRSAPTARYRLHKLDRICREHAIEHRLTKPNHPWTNGQVERMNSEATGSGGTLLPLGSRSKVTGPGHPVGRGADRPCRTCGRGPNRFRRSGQNPGSVTRNIAGSVEFPVAVAPGNK
jgi:transposase-like protein